MEFTPEVPELLLTQPTFEERACVDARRGVPLEVHDIRHLGASTAEEMIEADLVEGRRRGVGGDVPADVVVRNLIGPHHHGHRVPSHHALDPALDLAVAGVDGLLCDVNCVEVRGVGCKGLNDAPLRGVCREIAQEFRESRRSVGLQYGIE